MNARIFAIKRFAVHDGDGIRTTVFFKGCPLKCKWCHNPEGINFKPQLAFYENKCVSCGECIRACTQNAHIFMDGIHIFCREKCIACGKCENVCPHSALTLYGKEMTVDELMPLLLEDRDFYQTSGGGITLSGGECLAQADFCAELLKRLKKNGIHTAVDTCGFVSKEAIDRVIPYTDVFLYDLKAFDENVHIKCTGQPNKVILKNLRYIDQCGKMIEIRIPYVPEYNSDQIEKIASYMSGIRNLIRVRILAYHNYAGSKYKSLGMENSLPEVLPDQTDIKAAADIISRRYGIKVVV